MANFANNLNTAGATSNSGLQNSSVTVTAGTGMSGGGAVALGSSVTLNNAGVTSVSAGTGISVSASTGGVTITNTSSASGTVTSVATGNGLQGGTITSSGTLSVACPTFNTVGSYCFMQINTTSSFSSGANFSASSTVAAVYVDVPNSFSTFANILSGTWKWMSCGPAQAAVGNYQYQGIACRVS